MMRRHSAFWLVGAVLLVAGCGGGSGTTTKTPVTPTISALPSASAITYGQTLASLTLTGGTATANGTTVSGTFAWSTSTTAPTAGQQSESVIFTPADTTDYTTVTGTVMVTVGQATPTVSAWPTASTIAYGQTLASSSLNGGTGSVAGAFVWTTPTTAPGVGTASQSVTFTPTDATDYATVTGSVTLTVAAAAPTISVSPAASGITYGQTLASSTLSGGTATANGTAVSGTFAWTTPTTAPAPGTQSESVTFTPTNTTDYTAVVGATTIVVSKATPTISTLPTASAITYGQTLASSTLTGGAASLNGSAVSGTFAWTTPSTAPAQGTDSESVTFTPSNTTDYAAVTGTVSVTVNPPAPTPVTVAFGTTYQTIRGFGGSTAWLGTMPTAVATALFSPTNGLGLSMLRVRIDPEGSASGGGTHGKPYETSQWDQEAANGQEAVAANSNAIVFASPWTPPAAWKLNGSATHTFNGGTWNESFASCAEGSGYCGGYLDPNHYADYANFLEDFVSFFNTNAGFDLYAISMQNEPDWNTTYESCVWDPGQMDTWVAGNASTITSDAYSTKFIMPESLNFNPVQAATALADPSAEGLISIIGGHLYGVQPTAYSIPSGDTPKELWMTEYGPGSTATPTFAQVLTTYGESIHDAMVNGQYNAYVWWGVFGASTGANGGGTNAGSYGLVDNAGNQTVAGWVFGQYSKFIQPGYVRASATATPVTGVYVSAYTGTVSGTQHYVIVAINANSTTENLGFTLNNGSGVTSLTPYQSTSSAGLAAQSAVTVTSGQFTYTLPAQSITTFVQ